MRKNVNLFFDKCVLVYVLLYCSYKHLLKKRRKKKEKTEQRKKEKRNTSSKRKRIKGKEESTKILRERYLFGLIYVFVIDMFWYDHSLCYHISTGVYCRDLTFIYSPICREYSTRNVQKLMHMLSEFVAYVYSTSG